MRLLLVLIALVMVAPVLATHDPMRTNTDAQRLPPSAAHVLGTDALGRDVWSRLAVGGGRTFGMAALASFVALLPGVIGGILLSSASRRTSAFAEISLNALLAFPSLIFALIALTVLGSAVEALILAVGIAQIAPTVRVVRGAAVAAYQEGYVESARALGASPSRIVFMHILPNIAPTLLAYTGVIFSYSLLNSAALSFLGLGGQPGVPDWGVMLAEGRQAFRSAPWVALAPGAAITASIMIVNRAADQVGRHPRR